MPDLSIPHDGKATQDNLITPLDFLRWFYPDATGYLTIFTLPGEQTKWFQAHDLEPAARYALQQAPKRNVYFGVGLRAHRGQKGRGHAGDVSAIPALWADIDIASPVHKVKDLPPTLDDAIALMQHAIPLSPSIIVDSGHGIQPYWLLKEIWTFDDAEERQRAGSILQRLQATLQATARLSGWHVDSTFDLARVLRLPGTWNRKAEPVSVRILEADPQRRYNPSDFEPFLMDVEATESISTAPATLPDELPTIAVTALKVSPRMKYLIRTGEDSDNPQRYPSRSEAVFGVIQALIKASYDDATIAAVLLDPRNGIGEKPREQGRRWVEQEIARARSKGKVTAGASQTPPAHMEGAPPRGAVRASGEAFLPDDADVQDLLARVEADPLRDDEGKLVIRVTPEMTAIVDNLQQAIQALPYGPHLFQRARQLCIVGRSGEPPKWLRRPPDAPIISVVASPYVRELASRAARWETYDARKERWKPTLPPGWVIDTLFARPGWPFPPLEGVVAAPTLRPDGSLLSTPGYDVETGLYVDFNGTVFPPLPARPTLDDARTAIGRLQEVFAEFPFAQDGHFSATLSAVLSLVARHAIDGNVPLFAVRSTTRGSGKGLLIDAISMIATGRHAPRWAQTFDEEEERKRLLTIALAGDALTHIDNVVRPLGSGPLNLALTAPTFKDRLLGKQVSCEAPMQVVFFASGNNMTYMGDLARRVVPIDFDPQMERPEERKFKRTPLLPWVLKERPRLVVAALTILKAYVEAGTPPQGTPPLGSFEAWSDLVRQALIWAGEKDPCLGRFDIEAESNPEFESLSSLLAAWHDRYGTDTRTVRQVKDDLDTHMVQEQGTERWIIHPEWRDLHEALVALDTRGREINTRGIGEALRAWKGRIVAGRRFIKAGTDRSQVVEWRIDVVRG